MDELAIGDRGISVEYMSIPKPRQSNNDHADPISRWISKFHLLIRKAQHTDSMKTGSQTMYLPAWSYFLVLPMEI